MQAKPDLLDIHTCGDCGQPMFKICTYCDGEGITANTDMFGHLDCDECHGTGWKAIDCACVSFDRTGHISAQFPNLEGKI